MKNFLMQSKKKFRPEGKRKMKWFSWSSRVIFVLASCYLLFSANFSQGQTTINFDDAAKWIAGSGGITSYQVDHQYVDGVFSATGGPALRNGTTAQDGFPGALGTYSWRLNTLATVDWRITIASGGVSTFSMKVRRWDSSPNPNYNLEYSTNGGVSWTFVSLIDNAALSNSSDWTTINGTINNANPNILIRVVANAASERLMIDDFTWTAYSVTPVLNVSPSALSGFSYTVGAGPSTSQSYTINGSNLTGSGNITMTGSTNYEVSSDNVTFGASFTLPYAGGVITGQPRTVYVRLKAGLSAGAYNGETISNAGGGASTVYVTCDGDVINPSVSCATDLIISEYIEGSSNNKFLELYNGTGSSVDLADYSLAHYNNGSATPTYTLTLSGTLADATTYVIENSGESLGVTADLSTAASLITFNGDDAIALLHSGTIIDVIGQIGTDPGSEWGSGLTSTADNTLRRKATVLAGDANGADAFDPSVEWDGFATDDVSGLGSHTMSCGATLIVSPAALTGFSYAQGSGPSASQNYVLSGINLTGFPDNITVTGSTNYQVSLDDITFTASVLVPYTSATLSSVDIYVRLKAGLLAGTYNGELIANAGGGATTVNVTCDGIVTGPTLTASVSTLTGMDYLFGAGPSPSQNYTLTGTNLIPAAGNISVGPLVNFQFSLDNISFFNSLTIPYVGSTLAASTIYMRLNAGLAINTYSGIVNHSGGSASTTVSAVGIVNDPSALPTVFDPGDIAVVGVNSNINCIFADNGADEISFVAFKNINTGTKFYVTDNGYQRVNALEWGDTEGIYEITRTGAPIAAGTVITFRFLNIGPFMIYVYPDTDWTFSKVSGFSGNMVLNTNGDQLYFMQGGTWANGGASHDATYSSGTYLFAFNTYSAWVDFGASTQRSGLIGGMECFSMMPGVATDFIKFTSAVDGWSATSKRGWIDRINNPANWTNCGVGSPVDPTASCANYNSIAPDYAAGYSITINAGGFSPGIWTGDQDINWFNCGNWQDLTIPDSTTNVSIPSSGVTFEPTIGDPPTVPVAYTTASCNNIQIQSGRTLTMNQNKSKLSVFGNFANDGSLSHTLGTISLKGNTNTTFGGSSAINMWKFHINKTAAANTATLGQNIRIDSLLTFTRGKLITSTYTINVETNNYGAVVAGTGNVLYPNSYAIGYLKRKIASNTNTYDFPVGVTAFSRLAQFVNSNLVTTGYVTISFDETALVGNTGSLSVFEGATALTTICPEGVWQIDPDLQPTAGSYGFKLYFTGFGSLSAADNNAFSIIKRPTPAGLGDLGTFTNGGGTISAANGPGRLYTDGYAYKWNLATFSQFAIAKAGGPLPVDLLSFSTECKADGIMVKWSTASEQSNDYFTLERSTNASHYKEVARIAGAGNSNQLLNYEYLDSDNPGGLVYYRLRQTDYDGSFKDFGPISSDCDLGKDAFNIIDCYAENGSINLVYTIPGNETVSYCVYELTGRCILQETQSGNAGMRYLNFNVNVPGGIYLIRLSDGKEQLSVKVMIK